MERVAVLFKNDSRVVNLLHWRDKGLSFSQDPLKEYAARYCGIASIIRIGILQILFKKGKLTSDKPDKVFQQPKLSNVIVILTTFWYGQLFQLFISRMLRIN